MLKNNFFHGMNLLQLCGSGAYGDVYLAEDVSGRKLAVKIVSKKKIGDGWERELKGVINYRKITEDHPELLQIYHVEEDEESFFYTMEPADSIGEAEYKPDTLAERLQNGALPETDLFKILSEIFAEIRLIHEAGFAHRDIKPDNILFVKGKPKLGDIGLMSSLTATMTQLAGTLDFLPPEQRTGTGGFDKISRQKSDLYAFGKVIYCSVTGLPPQDFPSISANMPGTLISKLFLHLAFRLCDSDPARRIERISELTEAFSDIDHKLIYGETFRDKVSLLWKNTGLFLRVTGSHTLAGVKKHYLLVSGVTIAFGLTGYFAIRHFLTKTDPEVEKIIKGVQKQKSADLNLYSFCNGRYTFDFPKEWQVFDRVAFIPRFSPRQIKLNRHTQMMILPDQNGNVIHVTYILKTGNELKNLPDQEFSRLFPTGIRIEKIQRQVKHGLKMDAMMVIGTLGADTTMISYLYPQANRTIALTLYQKGEFPDDQRTKFIVAADSFAVHPECKWKYEPDPDGRTPLMSAIFERDYAEAEHLLKAGAKVDEIVYNGSTALFIATLDDVPDSVRFLLKHGANVNHPDEIKFTPLHRAAYEGYSDLVQILLAVGAKLELRDNSDRTPLAQAVAQSQPDCVKLLLEAGANPNITVDDELKTPLIILAVVQDNPAVLRLLLQHKIELNALNDYQENALLRVLDISTHDKNPAKREMAKILIEAGINVNQQNEQGHTALMYAAHLGDGDLVTLLLKRGAKKDLKDRKGRTAADYCNAQKYPEIKKILNSL